MRRLSSQIGPRQLRFDIGSNLPQVNGDAGVLERVLINILENAIRYSPVDQPVTLTAQRKGRSVVIAVTDKGAGIPESERERVFDMFYRIKAAQGATHGAGLGLSICRGFIEAHKGRIVADTGEGGVGTKIMIYLPAAKEEA